MSPAPPASASACEYDAVGIEGTYSVAVVGRTATLTIHCYEWFSVSTTSARASVYPRLSLTSDCHASLSSTGSAATATLT